MLVIDIKYFFGNFKDKQNAMLNTKKVKPKINNPKYLNRSSSETCVEFIIKLTPSPIVGLLFCFKTGKIIRKPLFGIYQAAS